VGRTLEARLAAADFVHSMHRTHMLLGAAVGIAVRKLTGAFDDADFVVVAVAAVDAADRQPVLAALEEKE